MSNVNSGLCQGEKDFLTKRFLVVRNSLQELYHTGEAPKIPTIAVVASGGGSRAMFATLGVLKGLIELNLFNTITYLCGLSGSTWALASVYEELLNNPNGGLKEVINRAGENAANRAKDFSFIGEFVTGAVKRTALPYHDMPAFIQAKKLCNQPVSNTDYYSAGIARTLFGKGDEIYSPKYEPTYLSSMKELLDSARVPMPIFTAGGSANDIDPEPVWFEFTPYEVGTVLGEGKLLKGAFIPTELFGSHYVSGYCTHADPEQPLEFYLGVCGSALNVSIANLYSYLPQKLQVKLLNPDLRLTSALIRNPLYNLTGMPKKYMDTPTLNLFDAGLIFNLPYPALNAYGTLRKARSADIIIFIDATDDNYGDTQIDNGPLQPFDSWPDGSTLRQVKEYADMNNIPFPTIPARGELNAPGTNVFHIYREPNAPLVIYYPVAMSASIFKEPADKKQAVAQEHNKIGLNKRELSKLQGQQDFKNDYQTKHTNLEAQQARMLMAIMEYNVLYSEEPVKEAIRRVTYKTVLKYEQELTEPQVKAIILSLKTGRKTIESLTLQECNAIIKLLHPEQQAFTKEKEAQQYLIRHEGHSLEHSVYI
jgi:hypothetical protein